MQRSLGQFIILRFFFIRNSFLRFYFRSVGDDQIFGTSKIEKVYFEDHPVALN